MKKKKWMPTKTVEQLIEFAEAIYEIPQETTYNALIELNPDAIKNLFKNLKGKFGTFISALCDKAKQAERDTAYYALLSALEVLRVDIVIIATLHHLNEKRAVPLLRQILEWVRESHNIEFASRAIISLEYNGDSIAALQDESFPLRKYIARQLEKQQDSESLINALSNDAPQVRQIAAWYLGRTKTSKAKEILQAQLQHETDAESKRAIEWALDILEKYTDG